MNYPSDIDVQDTSEQRTSEETSQAGLPSAIDPTQVATAAPSPSVGRCARARLQHRRT